VPAVKGRPVKEEVPAEVMGEGYVTQFELMPKLVQALNV
jgi:hypothetical protein